MTLILGNTGNVLLRRANSISWRVKVSPDDINTVHNRLGLENAIDNILTGDRIQMSTDDPRGLLFLPTSTWKSGQVEKTAAPYVHSNIAGGLRLYNSFAEAAENNRANEITLISFGGSSLDVTVSVRDTIYNSLGYVENYTFNSDRNTIDVTELGDNFRQMYDNGLIQGAGTINCLFKHVKETPYETDKELPVIMMQLLQRIDIGSQFAANLVIADGVATNNISAFYSISAVVTRSGVDVRAGDITKVALDFVTTSDYRLLIGDPAATSGFLTEGGDLLEKERGLGYLLKEVPD